MQPVQRLQHPCGCIDEIYASGLDLVMMCPQHLSKANSPGPKPPLNTILPPLQTPNTTGGIPLHAFPQFQMGGGFHPGQMPPPGVHIRMPTQGTNR